MKSVQQRCNGDRVGHGFCRGSENGIS